MDAIRDLDPGYFAFVMATGIISTGTYLLGPSWLSRTLEPPYWILMGATAITVLAGAEILGLPGTLPAVRATAGFVGGFSCALWAFGTWWIPLLVMLGFWRHVRHRWPLTYEPSLWSAVFPLGMYSVATLAYGQAAGHAFMKPLARVMIW